VLRNAEPKAKYYGRSRHRNGEDKLSSLPENTCRRFLLGIASEEEERRVEDAVLAGDLDTLFLLDQEDSLIDDYLLGTLTEEERHGFRAHFLSNEERQQRLAFASTLIEYARKQPAEELVREKLAPHGRNHLLLSWKAAALLASAAMVVLAALVGFQHMRLGQQEEVASAERNELSQLRAALDSRNVINTPPNEKPTAPTSNPQVGMELLPKVELASTKRSVIPPLLRISTQAQFAQIKVKVSGPLAAKYRVVLIAKGDRLLALEFPASNLPSNKEITLVLPTWTFQKGSYHLQLEGSNAEGHFDQQSDWVFNVEKE
jgi:hypothetical protein